MLSWLRSVGDGVVGLLVGILVGRKVGPMLGNKEFLPVNLGTGFSIVGVNDGTDDGYMLGDLVGLLPTIGVGPVKMIGLFVGTPLGKLVGTLVGSDVGLLLVFLVGTLLEAMLG